MERADTRARASRGPCRPWGGGGGGVGSPPRRFPPAPPTAARFRLAAAGAAAVALTALLAAPPVAVAQSCTPTGYTGTLPTITYDGTTDAINCNTLTGGLEMTLGPDLQLGTEASPLTGKGIEVEAEGDGNNDIVVMGSGTIYADLSGIWLLRDGTGLLKLEFPKGKIVAGGSSEGKGIYLQHKGAAGEETKGIHIVSGADIDLSAHTSDRKNGIQATTRGADATATIPIVIQVTGGTIDVSDPASSTPTSGGLAIHAEQYAKGDIAITVEPAARLGTKEAVAGAYGIRAGLDAGGEGDIAITHRGSIHAGTGISAANEATSAKKGNITITTDPGSTIVAKEFKEYNDIYEEGISARIQEATSTGDITIAHNGEIDADGKGINASNSGKGDSTVTTGADSKITAVSHGIEASGGGGIEIAHNGEIKADGQGIYAFTSGKGDMTVTTGTGSKVVGGETGISVWLRPAGEGDIMITHRGRIDAAAGDGIGANNDATSAKKGNITITTEAGSTIGAQGSDKHGIITYISEHTSTGDIVITHKGAIDATRSGIYTYNNGKGSVTVTTGAGSQIVSRGADRDKSGIRAGVWDSSSNPSASSTADVTITHRGEITAKNMGINAFNRKANAVGTGAIKVTTAKGSKITADKQGILVWHQGTGKFDVAVRGMVMGDSAYKSGSDTDYAGVHIQVKEDDPRTGAGGGGKLVLGPMAHLSAKSGTAIKVDARAGAVTVLLEKDEYGLAGHLEGKILNADSTTTAFKTRTGETGTEMALSVGDRVDMRGATQGLYDKVHRTRLMRITGGHEFKKLSETRLYHDRTRVYEALPAVLLDLNGQLPYQERMAAPRDGDGLWARLAAGDGARRPARATTARGLTGRALAWDVAQYGFEGGLDFRPAATERLLLGVSLHARQGTATVAHGGTIEVSGFGGGGAATYRDAAGFYLDGRFSYTYFDDVDLTSRTRGMVQADLSGHGYALGLEAGKRLGWEGLDHVALTPRARVVWSTVELEDFADLAGSGRVALETATSLKGGLGLLAETAFGGATLKDWTGDGGRLFGSLDVEHEFSADRETVASGTALASEVQATWGRVGLGGTLIWTEGLTLSGEGFYATAGSDNTDFGGSLTLTLRF